MTGWNPFIGLHQTVWQSSNFPTADCQTRKYVPDSSQGTGEVFFQTERDRQTEGVSVIGVGGDEQWSEGSCA